MLFYTLHVPFNAFSCPFRILWQFRSIQLYYVDPQFRSVRSWNHRLLVYATMAVENIDYAIARVEAWQAKNFTYLLRCLQAPYKG